MSVLITTIELQSINAWIFIWSRRRYRGFCFACYDKIEGMIIDMSCWIKRDSDIPEDNMVKIDWGLNNDCIIEGTG